MYIEAIWIRRIGDKVQVLFESQGEWRLAIEESVDAAFSRIAEHPALEAAPVDQVAGNPYRRGGKEWITAKAE